MLNLLNPSIFDNGGSSSSSNEDAVMGSALTGGCGGAGGSGSGFRSTILSRFELETGGFLSYSGRTSGCEKLFVFGDYLVIV